MQYPLARDEERRDYWDGIAEGNLGRNRFLCGDEENAIPFLKNSIEKVLRFNDYGYAVVPSTTLALCYINKGNLKEAKRYIDLAINYYAKMPQAGYIIYIHETLSKYYSVTGNSKLSIAYMDSTLTAVKKYSAEFNALQLMRVEQRKFLSEQKIKEEQLQIEKVKNIGYQRILANTIVGLLIIGGILVRYFLLYRKKKAAYKELVSKAQEWAQVEITIAGHARNDDELRITNEEVGYDASVGIENEEIEEQNSPDEIDFLIMNSIEKLMSEEKLYTDTALTLEWLAKKLNSKRHYVSAAINNCTQKSYNTFINEYRIKEAIQLLSKENAKIFSIDQVAFDAGFNDRKNFYKVFKKMTGLSPTEFRNNVGLN
jgi:YesN/AraC family two-component response regulator